MLSRVLKSAVGAVAGAVLGLISTAAVAAVPATVVKLLTNDIAVSADGTWSQKIHAEIRANTAAAAARLGQTSVQYDSSTQELVVDDAHTLKPDGSMIPVAPAAIYDQMPNGTAAAITQLRAKVIVFPQLAAGDVAVYSVTVVSKVPYFPGAYWYGEIYPRTVAYEDVRETIAAPKSLPLYAESHGVDIDRSEVAGKVVYGWHYAAPAPLDPELRPVSPIDSEPRVFVSSFKDYAELGRAYADVSKPRMKVTPTVAALADAITKGIDGRRDQAKALYDWVSRHVRYVAIELGRGSFVPHDPDAVIANGYGDCKDHVVLLGALLKAKDIESESLLINSGNAYTLSEVPTFATLDHVINWVPEFDLYLDSSVMVAPFGVLPLEEYGKPVVRALEQGAGLATLPSVPAGLATIAVKTDARLDVKGSLSGTTTTTATGPYTILLRTIGAGIQNVGPDVAAARQLASLGYTNATGTFDVGAPMDVAPSYSIAGTFDSPGWADKLSDSTPFYIPGGLRLLGLSGDGPMGPFQPPSSLKDDAPILCLSAQASEDLALHLPAGMHFDGVPADTDIHTASLRFTAHWTLQGDTLSVHRDFASTIDGPVCSAATRKQNGAALKSIAASYEQTLTVSQKDAAGARSR
ncbi:MAG TPA: DUF3857 and transglutaminase domain-containing protein [Rhizomicrobium sp.]